MLSPPTGTRQLLSSAASDDDGRARCLNWRACRSNHCYGVSAHSPWRDRRREGAHAAPRCAERAARLGGAVRGVQVRLMLRWTVVRRLALQGEPRAWVCDWRILLWAGRRLRGCTRANLRLRATTHTPPPQAALARKLQQLCVSSSHLSGVRFLFKRENCACTRAPRACAPIARIRACAPWLSCMCTLHAV